MLNNVKVIPIYVRVPHSQSSIFMGVLASTSFTLCNNTLATIVLMCLCLQNKYITMYYVSHSVTESILEGSL